MRAAIPLLVGMPLLLAACGGGTPPAATVKYTASVAYAPSSSGGAEPTQTATPLVLFDQQFLDWEHGGYLLALLTTPALPSTAHVTWTSSNSAVVPVEKQEPFTVSVPTAPAPTAPPNETFVQVGTSHGTAIITAYAVAPDTTASITAYSYPALSFGCAFRYQPAFAFDPDRASLMTDSANWTSADLYDTSPAASLHPLDPCLNSPLAVSGGSETWHMPYGAVVLPAVSLQAFTAVSATAWRNAGTSFAPALSSLVLLKTKEGRIVKAFLPIGPYEVSDTNGTFAY